MSKFPGGIFSKARGKTSGIVFSAARTREGKVMTSRGLTIPANPQTPLQQGNRGIFEYCQQAVRSYGRDIYHNDWNRGVSDLPGYQSLISLLKRRYWLDSYGASAFYAVWTGDNPDTLLGELHFPETFLAAQVGLNQIQLNWSTELGQQGSADDELIAIAAKQWVDEDREGWYSYTITGAKRGDGSQLFTAPSGAGNEVELAVYFRNRLNETPYQLSIARWLGT